MANQIFYDKQSSELLTGPAAEEGAGVREAGSGLVSAKFMGTFSIANVWGGPKVTECKAWCGGIAPPPPPALTVTNSGRVTSDPPPPSWRVEACKVGCELKRVGRG